MTPTQFGFICKYVASVLETTHDKDPDLNGLYGDMPELKGVTTEEINCIVDMASKCWLDVIFTTPAPHKSDTYDYEIINEKARKKLAAPYLNPPPKRVFPLAHPSVKTYKDDLYKNYLQIYGSKHDDADDVISSPDLKEKFNKKEKF